MKILIIQTAFIGDVILASGLIEKLKDYYPESEIDFLLRKGNEGLFENHPKLRKVIIFDKKEGKYKNLAKIISKLRKEKYDIVINVQRFATSGIIAGFSGGKQIIGFNKNPMSFLFTKKISHVIGRGHEIERNHHLIEELTDSVPAKPKLYPSEENFKKVKDTDQYICMAPSSVWFTKGWPTEKWIELIKSLNEKYRIYLLGGKGDYKKCNEIIAQSGSKRTFNQCGNLSFLESTALMANAKMNFVNDSAPMHMASAMNAPVSALYCSTVPRFGFGPLSKQSFVFETQEDLACRPCGLHGKKECPEGHFKCANINIQKIVLETQL